MSSPSGRFKPISEPRAMSLLPHRIWSEEDWERIQLGYFAKGMDDKWNVFAEGDVVFLHRSWTGRGIFAATFAPADGGGRRIVEAVVERDPRRYRGQDEEYDCLMLELVLSAIVLGEPARELRAALVESARRKSGDANAHAGVVLHSTLGLRSEP